MVEITEPITIVSQLGTLFIRYIGSSDIEGVAITYQDKFPEVVPVRIQSSCLFSESLQSIDCDCADQLHESIKIIASEGGLVIYLYDEGRGAGLKAKIEAIKLQQTLGLDTATAYTSLGFEPDVREYITAAQVIASVLGGECNIELITNNLHKVAALQDAGIHIVRRRPIVCIRNATVEKYLQEKSRVLGHIVNFGNGFVA